MLLEFIWNKQFFFNSKSNRKPVTYSNTAI